MNFGGGDAGIMSMRSWCENFWLNSIPPETQALWLSRWAEYPPTDTVGRQYVIPPRINIQQTERPAATVYAWAVGWEVYWLNMLPVITPPPLPTARPTYSISSQKNTEVKILCSMANSSSARRPTILYANQGTHAPSTGGQYRTRFIGGIAEPIDGYEFDITANLAQIKPLVAGESWWLECFQCGDGSGVTRLTTPLKIVVTAS